MRNTEINRRTAETDISLWLELDGSGRSDIDSGCGFLNHMLTLLAKHAGFDLVVKCVGDTEVDDHHSVEDIGICLGQAIVRTLGDKRGIRRYGSTTLPMDEVLLLTAVDISGRSCLVCDLDIPTEKVGSFDTELVEEFLQALVRSAGLTLHVRQLAGRNSHHIIEACFKSLARSLREAVEIDPRFAREIPSSKGMLEGGEGKTTAAQRPAGDAAAAPGRGSARPVQGEPGARAAVPAQRSTSERGQTETLEMNREPGMAKARGLDNTLLPESMRPAGERKQNSKAESSDELERALREKGLL